LNTGIVTAQSVSVPNGYNFPKTYNLKAFMCENCGKIELYADKQNKEQK